MVRQSGRIPTCRSGTTKLKPCAGSARDEVIVAIWGLLQSCAHLHSATPYTHYQTYLSARRPRWMTNWLVQMPNRRLVRTYLENQNYAPSLGHREDYTKARVSRVGPGCVNLGDLDSPEGLDVGGLQTFWQLSRLGVLFVVDDLVGLPRGT